MPAGDRIGRRIKLQDLRVLMAVSEAGSMNRAAAVLHTTQPAISRSIGELERTVGVRLLDRTARGVEPTAYGRALLEGGAAMFDGLHQAVKNIEFLADPSAGEVRIACNPILATSFLNAVIDRLSRRHPRITFQVVLKEADSLFRELTGRNVDLLIARRFGDLPDAQLDFEFLFADSYVIAAGAGNPWARRRRVALGDLVNEPWTLPPPDQAPGLVAREVFRSSGLDYPRVTVATAAPEMRISLLATGRFLSIFPNSVLRFPTGRPEVKVLPVSVPVPPVPVGIVTVKRRMLSPVAQRFIEAAREVAKPLAPQK